MHSPQFALYPDRRVLPIPQMVFADTDYGMAYAWKCEGYGISSMGNTRLDAQVQFQKDFEEEYGEVF